MTDFLRSQDPVLYLCLALWVLVMVWATAVGLLDWGTLLVEDVAALPHPDDDTDEEVVG